METLFILFETASGYSLFKKEEYDETGGQLKKVQKAITELDRFKKMVTFEAQYSFKTAEEALENMQAIAHNKCSSALKSFLSSNLVTTTSSKKQKFALGIHEPRLGPEIFEATGITASYNETIVELLRGIRTHYPKLLKSK
jgi:nucleolar protein 56